VYVGVSAWLRINWYAIANPLKTCGLKKTPESNSKATFRQVCYHFITLMHFDMLIVIFLVFFYSRISRTMHALDSVHLIMLIYHVEMKHFIERCLNRKMAKRASIDELAHHPWLNNASSPHEEHEDYRTKRQYYEFTRIYDDIDMYIPEDHRTFKIQLTNEQMKKLQADAEMEEIVENFESGETDDSVDIHKNPDDVDIHGIARHHESYEKDETFQVDQTAIDWRIVDEACAGYWGWIRIFGTEVFPHDEFYSFLQEHAHMSFDSDMQRPEIALYVLIRTLYRNKHPCASFFRVGGSSLDHCKGNEEIVEDMKISLMEWRGRRSSLVTYVDDEQSRRTSDVSNVSDADTIRVSKAALLPVPVVPQISLVVE
jgi:hypothetical protein